MTSARIDEVYNEYKKNGYFAFEEDHLWYLDKNLTKKEEKSIESVWKQLGKLPPGTLVRMSVNESIFKEGWNSKAKTLHPDKIKDYFKKNYVVKENLA